MKRLAFYIRYGFRNIQRGGRWTALAIFCIAAGVATVVALRGLGLAIGDSLQENVRYDNKGDVRLIKGNRGAASNTLLRGTEDAIFFSDEELLAVEEYVNQRGGRMTSYITGGNVQIASVNEGIFGTAQFISTFLVDPETYPPNYEIVAIEPAGVPLRELFTGANEIVISENMAINQNLAIGDVVRIARTEEEFTVVGIVGAENEAGIRNIFGAFFGFAYIDLETAQRAIDPALRPNNIAVFFDEPLTLENEESVLRELERRATRTTRQIRSDTALELLDRNQTISQVIGDFIVVMGLGALLIGGVGIMNTMLVLVRRRTNEIAALKTFGLKGGQVGLLFLAEGLLLGLIGSVVGSIAGVLLGGIVNRYGEQFLQQSLPWRIYPEALLYGFALGMVITIIFGLAPILTALQIRPGIILRPNENHTPRLGVLQSLGLMIVVTVLIGLIVGQIISPSVGLSSSFAPETPYLWGVIGVAGTLLLLGILTGLLWIVVWLVGKMPSFGSVDLRLALRNMSTQRLRTATTLLALSAGMFALSSITFVGEGTRELLNLQLSKQFNGNVLAFPIVPTIDARLLALVERNLEGALQDVPGITARTTLGSYRLTLTGVDGRAVRGGSFESDEFEETNVFDAAQVAPFVWSSAAIWESDSGEIYDNIADIVAGRNLTTEDRGKQVLIGPADSAALLGINVGSQLSYQVGDTTVMFEVVGLYQVAGGLGGGGPIMPPDALGETLPFFQIYSYQVERQYVGQAVAELSTVRVPRTVALDVSFIDSLISRLINQFAAIPTVVGLLSLIAAAVIMANTVALSTLERQRQIGILKAIGLKSKRVLRIMLIESVLVGLLSALLGIGLSLVFLWIFSSLSGTVLPMPRESQIVGIALVIAAILIGALATFLSANVAVRERVMNVLRYE